jgi:capsular exopolysaccharide synthesis family protein
MLQVRFLNPDPNVAVAVVNTLVNDYLERNFQIQYRATAQVSDWLSSELTNLRAQVEASEQKLVEYQKQAGILGSDENNNVVMTKLEELNKQLTTAEANRIFAHTVFQLVRSGDPELLSSAAGSNSIGGSIGQANANSLTVIQNLRLQESQLKAQYAQAATKYGSAFPKLVELRSQLNSLNTSIQTEIQKLYARAQNDYLVAKKSEDVLRASFESQKAQALKLNDAAIHYTLQKHEVEANRNLYEALLTKLKEAGVLAGLRSTNVVVIDPARTTADPARPRYVLNTALGLLVGLFGGLVYAFVKSGLDTTVRTPQQVEAATALPSLAILPEVKIRTRHYPLLRKKTHQAGVSVLADPSSEIAEAFRTLRTSVMMSESDRPPQLIMITSALPQEGKTATSINVAITLAQQNCNVLLVEADLRRPQLTSRLGVSPATGLSELLSGNAELHHYTQFPGFPNLFLLSAGSRPNNPSELLGSNRMKAAIDFWRHRFDFIVLDTPPVLSVTDPVLVSRYADAVVLVVRYGQTTRQSLVHTSEILARAKAKVAGVAVNRFDLNSLDYYQTYGVYSSKTREMSNYVS